MPTHQRQANNHSFCFRCCPTKIIPVRGWRFAPACCAAQSVLRRGPGCAVPLHRLVWAALNLHRHCELHQPSASAGLMKTVCASLSFGVRRPKQCGLTIRSTGPIAACRHLGYKSLAQMPAHRNGPVSSNVRRHLVKYMPLPPELKPTTMSRVMDLVESAGIDVSDWPNYKAGDTNPGANPKYCYEWALEQPGKLVVCNLWYENMREVSGNIEQHIVLADTPTRTERDPTRRARRSRMAALLAKAALHQLQIRVIVLDGKARTTSPNSKTQVKYRQLDPAPWHVTQADRISGVFILRRGAQSSRFIDQFELYPPPDGSTATSTVTVTVRSRSRALRVFALSRSRGKCEYCGAEGFKFPDETIYLETHHVISLSNGGPDSSTNVVALCANHHREAHHGTNAQSINEFLTNKLRGDA